LLKAKSVIILPAHNEEAAIEQVVRDVLVNCSSDILIACSGCTDGTTGKVKELAIDNSRVHYINCPKGKGLAIKKAFDNILVDKVVMMDSDGTYPAKSIPVFLRALDKYPVAVGVRRMDNANMPWGNKYSNKFVSFQARLLFGIPIYDLCCGMWGFTGDIPHKMNLQSYGFTLETEMWSYVAGHKLLFTQIPIDYYLRIGERKINRLDHLKIWSAIWTRRFG
jgi:glycosyltransferase involved in cell wall biosynthesis